MSPPGATVSVADAASAGAQGRAEVLGRARSVRFGQVVAVQAAGLVLVYALPASWWWRAPAIVLLVVVVTVVAGRYRGRWLYAWIGVLVAYRLRRRADGRPAPPGQVLGDPAVGLEIEAFVDRAGTRFGVIDDGRALTTVLAVEPADTAAVAGFSLDTIDLEVLAGVLADRDVRLARVQVVLRCVPAPSPRVDLRSPVALSYRDVAAGVAAQRVLLVCLQLDPSLCPTAVAGRGGGDLGARRALASVTARLAARIGTGARVRPLGPDDVRAAVAVGLGTAPGPTTERWSGLHSRDAVHTAFRLTSWGADEPTALLSRLSAVPGIANVVSMTLTRVRDDATDLRLVLRVVSLPKDVAAVEAAVTAAAGRSGARVVRLAGEHAVATALTLPTGGTRWAGAAAREALFRVDRPWLRRLWVPLDRGGLVLGRDDSGNHVVLQMFRDRPSTISAVLDPRVVMVMCYRALAIGARVSVISTRTDRWLPLRHLGVNDPGVVSIAAPEAVDVLGSGARADRPHLVVLDLPDRRDPPPRTGQPWQTVLTVLPELSVQTLPSTRAAGLMMMRRLSRTEATAAAPVLGLPSGADRSLTTLADRQFSTVERGRLLVVNLALTGAESHLLVASTAPPRGSASVPRTLGGAARRPDADRLRS